MKRVRIYRCKDSALRTRFRRCVLFYLEKLMPRQKKMSIKIFFNSELYKKHGMIGSCLADDWPADKRHKEFTIHIDTSLNFTESLAILAHELTHVKQYATAQMSYDYKNADNTIWNGKVYGPDSFSYKDCPWEIEAKMFESVLSHELITTTEIWK